MEVGAEINIHSPGRTNLDKAAVLIFPKLLVCLSCGFTEFAIPQTELRLLSKDAQRSIRACLKVSFLLWNKQPSVLHRFSRGCHSPVRGLPFPTHSPTRPSPRLLAPPWATFPCSRIVSSVRRELADSPSRFYSVQQWDADVEQNQIRSQFLRFLDCF